MRWFLHRFEGFRNSGTKPWARLREPVFRWRAARFLALAGLALPAMASAAPPADVALLQQYEDTGRNSAPLTDEQVATVIEQLAGETLSIVDEVARTRGYPAWFSSENPVIVAEVKGLVQEAVESAKRSPKALVSVGKDALSGRYAEVAMARAAGLVDPPQASGSGSSPLSASGKVVNPSGPLKLQIDRSRITDDVGGSGHGNGRLDPGETARLTLTFENVGKTRLYSSSLYVESVSDCVLLGRMRDEHQLKELNPGDTDQLSIPLFASRQCAGKTVRLRLRGHDTQQFPAGMTYVVDLKLSDFGSSQLTGVQLDGDDYGHSEPTTVDRLKPNAQVELSAGLVVSGGGVRSVRQSFTVPKPLTARHEPGAASASYSGGSSTAGPVDDVDITLPGANALADGLQPHAARMEWTSPGDAILFAAVDSAIALDGPAVRSAAAGGAATVELNRKKVEQVLARHVTVTPVVTPGGGGGADTLPLVTVDGFRVGVDDPSALMAALEASSTVVEGVAAPAKGPAAAAYQVRHYIALPVEWEPEPLEVACSIRVKRFSHQLGEEVLLSGALENLPAGAEVTLVDSVAGELPVELDQMGAFRVTLTPASTGASSVDLTVMKGDDWLCQDTARYSVNPKPSAPAPAPVAAAKTDWPRRYSLELGTIMGQTSGQVGFSVGKTARFATRLSATPSVVGLGIGPRFSVATDEAVTVEFSGQALVGANSNSSQYGEVLAMLSIHKTVGGYVQAAGGVNSRFGSYGFVAAGLGIYFPK